MRLLIKHYFAAFYVLALGLIGIGYIFVLPLFEGLDETAHFSRIREISFTKKFNYTANIDQSITTYKGPMPYSTGFPPYDSSLIYSKFFQDQNSINLYKKEYRDKNFNISYKASNEPNWQYQHPPLYYLLTAPIVSLTQNLTLLDQFLLLRIFSYLMALIGVFITIKTLLSTHLFTLKSKQSNFLKISIVVYPIIFPEFFFEFARIGNDSLCLLIAGLLFYAILKWYQDQLDIKKSLILGSILGLGILTKAFFIPISFALGIFTFLNFSHNGYFNKKLSSVVKVFFAIVSPILFIGGSWYFMKYFATGDLGGGYEAYQLKQNIGFIGGFLKNYTLAGLSHGLLMPFATFAWIGSWSVVRMPSLMYVILILIGFWIAINSLLALRKIPKYNLHWLVFWLFMFMFLGLFWHVLIMVALSGYGASGGHYLHILFPWVIPALSLGLMRIYESNKQISFMILGIIYAVIFHLIAFWFHLSLFSGCASKGSDKHFIFNGNYYCIDEISKVIYNLAILNYSNLGIVLYIMGITLLVTLTCWEINGN
jgi:hypothetical protein